jgi:hypothetical protein
MISGTVYVDLSACDYTTQLQRTDRYLLDVLNRVPDGARVVVDIGARAHVTQDAAVWLHDHDHRLAIEIRGSVPEAVAAFIRAGRTGEWAIA